MTETNESSLGFESVRGVPCDAVLRVEGTLPSWLRGTFVHTGPGLFELERGGYATWLDGLALLAAVEIDDGIVRYRSRLLESDAYRLAQRKGAPVYGEFATAPKLGLFGRLLARLAGPTPTDNDNVNVVHLGDRAIAMTESTRQRAFDPRTLATGAEEVYDDDLDGQLSTAHPWIDRRAGVLHNLLVRFGRRSEYVLYELPLGGHTRRALARLPVDRPSYVHSFAASDGYLVLTEIPLCVHPLRMRFSARPFIERYEWRPERETRIRVLRKDDGEVVSDVRAPARFLFHHVNAAEVDGNLELDWVAHPDPTILGDLRLDALRGPRPDASTGRLERVTLPLGAHGARVAPRGLSEHSLELPRISPALEGKRYRHVWAASRRSSGSFFDHLLRVDLRTGTAAQFLRDGWFPSEPLFVPAPGAPDASGENGEDEGVVLCTMLDARRRTSRFVVLDARDLRLRAEAALPHVVPFHFHSQFFAQESVDAPSMRDVPAPP
jgi:carotenoid cleavage dioxygenase-like enzyme